MNKAFRNHLILCAVFSGLLSFAIVLAAQSALPFFGKLLLAAGFLALAAYLWVGLARRLPQPRQDDAALLKARLHTLYQPAGGSPVGHAGVAGSRSTAAAPAAHSPAASAIFPRQPPPAVSAAGAAPSPAAPVSALPTPSRAVPAGSVHLQAAVPAASAGTAAPAPSIPVPRPTAPISPVPAASASPAGPRTAVPAARMVSSSAKVSVPVPEEAVPPLTHTTEDTLEQIFARIRSVAELDNDLSNPLTESERRAEFERLKAADLERQRRNRARAIAASAAGALHPGTDTAEEIPLPSAGAAPTRSVLPATPTVNAGTVSAAQKPMASAAPLPAEAGSRAARQAAMAPPAAAAATAASLPPAAGPDQPAARAPAAKPAARLDPDAAQAAAAAYAKATGKVPSASALAVAMAAGVPLDTPLDELPPLPEEEESPAEQNERNRVLVEAQTSARQLLKERAIHRALEEARQREGRLRTIEQSHAAQAHRHPVAPEAAPTAPEINTGEPPIKPIGL